LTEKKKKKALRKKERRTVKMGSGVERESLPGGKRRGPVDENALIAGRCLVLGETHGSVRQKVRGP